MSSSTLNGLPLETLFKLLIPAIKELLEALEVKDVIAIKVKKKQCELIHEAIVNFETRRNLNPLSNAPLMKTPSQQYR